MGGTARLMPANSTIQQVLDGEARWCVHHGDMLDALPLIPDNSVDAICCDAPYGLGEEPDIAKLLRAWLDDLDVKAGTSGFMNRKWDVVPGPRYWRECYRVLKPGGYLLTFAGTRTQDLMGMAIRLAGFEIRDSVAWLHAEGMAKSTNIERKIAMHQCTLPGRHYASTLPKPHKQRPGDHLCPETEESVKWKGQGSALAPSHEPIIVARKPLDGTYAESTLRWGTAMNIDATRIAHAGKEDFEQHKAGVDAIKKRGGSMDDSWKNSSDLSGASEVTTAGRWPKNTVLSHVGGPDGCKRIGTTTVAANPTWDTPNRATQPSAFTGERVSKVRHGREGEASAERRYTGNGSTSFAATPGPRRDAVEDVEQWECHPDCVVRMLAAQSGSRVGDSGTAARCFQQFGTSEFDEPFRYQSKPSRREKDRGLQHFRPRSAAEATDSEDGQERLNNARTGAGRTGGARNPHPTTKSVELCRWMVRLVARPGQLVCVPFAGSGSECIAAVLEGCSVIGIEWLDTDDEPFVSVARARLEHIDGREFIPRESLQPKREAEKPRQGVLF